MRSRSLIVSGLFFAVAGMALFLLIHGVPQWKIEESLAAYTLMFVLQVIVFLLFCWRWRLGRHNGSFDPTEVVVLYSAFLILGHSLVGFWVWLSPRPITMLPAIYYGGINWMPRGLLVVTVGLICMMAGARLAQKLPWEKVIFVGKILPKKVPTSWARFTTPRTTRVLIIWIIGVFAWFVSVILGGSAFGGGLTGALSIYNMTLGYLSDLRLLAISITALQVLRRRWPSWMLAILVGFEVLSIFSAGMMKPTLRLIIILGGAALYSGRKLLSRRSLPWLLIAVVLAFLAVPVAHEMRKRLFAERSVARLFEATVDSVQSSQESGVLENITLIQEWFLGRQVGVAQVVPAVVCSTPSIVPYQDLRSLILSPLFVIPRFLWPGKPVQESGIYSTELYYGKRYRQEGGTGAITCVGELYAHGGLWVVIGGMVITGLLYGILHRYLSNFALKYGLYGLVGMYLAVFVWYIDPDQSWIGLIQGIIQRVFVCGLATLFVCPTSSFRYRLQDVRTHVDNKRA